MQPLFDLESRQLSKTVVIAHVSPYVQDAAHSVNTLGYAAPFKVSVKKPSGPLPYDPKDPRTWDNAQTIKWLGDQFAKQVKAKLTYTTTSLKFPYKKIVHEPESVTVPVDLQQMLPEPLTGRWLARLYGSEFVDRCLAANLDKAPTEKSLEKLREMSLEVYFLLNHQLGQARTKSRTAVMKTRKPMDMAQCESTAT